MDPFDWTAFLSAWSRELLEVEELAVQLPAEVVASGWLGFPGATEQQLAQAEAHLGAPLPPSYRDFLRVTNGWRCTGPFIRRMWSTEEIEWFSVRHQDWIEAYADAFEAYADTDEPDTAGENYWDPAHLYAALEISDMGDDAIYLLNPRVVTANGEWEAWLFANWIPGAHTYPSFLALMQAEREGLGRLYS